MNEELLQTVELEPAQPATAAVIWMHGLGADAHDFEPVPPELGLPPELAVRFIFPNAPRIAVTLNMGLVMPAWYDITSLDARGQDEKGIRESARRVEQLIQREVDRGIPTERIVLAGFSQGGVIALHTGLRHARQLAGILVLSAYLVFPERLADEASPANQATPVFHAHGSFDPMVPIELGHRTRDELQGRGYRLEWHEYPMEHQVCIEELRAIGSWLGGVLAVNP